MSYLTCGLAEGHFMVTTDWSLNWIKKFPISELRLIPAILIEAALPSFHLVPKTHFPPIIFHHTMQNPKLNLVHALEPANLEVRVHALQPANLEIIYFEITIAKRKWLIYSFYRSLFVFQTFFFRICNIYISILFSDVTQR